MERRSEMAEEERTQQICPLLAAGWAAAGTVARKENVTLHCLTVDCAWYNVLREACAVSIVAVQVHGIRQALHKR